MAEWGDITCEIASDCSLKIDFVNLWWPKRSNLLQKLESPSKFLQTVCYSVKAPSVTHSGTVYLAPGSFAKMQEKPSTDIASALKL